MILLVKF